MCCGIDCIHSLLCSASEGDQYIMLVSGLSFGETIAAPDAANEPLGGAAFATGIVIVTNANPNSS